MAARLDGRARVIWSVGRNRTDDGGDMLHFRRSDSDQALSVELVTRIYSVAHISLGYIWLRSSVSSLVSPATSTMPGNSTSIAKGLSVSLLISRIASLRESVV